MTSKSARRIQSLLAASRPLRRLAASGSLAMQQQQCFYATVSSSNRYQRDRHNQQSSSRSRQQKQQQASQKINFSSWSGRGHDVLAESFLAGAARPKVLLEAMAPSGFDVSNLLKKIDPNEVAPHGALHMMGSIVAFPHACFLWKHIEVPSDITVESLAPVLLHRPKIEFLFIGTAKPMNQDHLNHLKKEMKDKGKVVVEWLPLVRTVYTVYSCTHACKCRETMQELTFSLQTFSIFLQCTVGSNGNL